MAFRNPYPFSLVTPNAQILKKKRVIAYGKSTEILLNLNLKQSSFDLLLIHTFVVQKQGLTFKIIFILFYEIIVVNFRIAR